MSKAFFRNISVTTRRFTRFVGLLIISAAVSVSVKVIAQDASEKVAEVTVFGTDERTELGNEASSDLINLNRSNKVKEVFNGAERTTETVSIISAGALVIEEGHENGLWEKYHNMSNIKRMEIMAETLVIKSAWSLKATDVSIYSREIRFEGSSYINTSARQEDIIPDAAKSPTVPGIDGADGINAGNINFWVGTYDSPSTNVDLVSIGGKGQAAGKGQHGSNGSSVDTYPSDSIPGIDTSEIWPHGFVLFKGLVYPIPKDASVTAIYGDKTFGSGNRPTNGHDALPAGKPGNGANGGTLNTNIAGITAELFANQGGKAGAKGSAPATTRSSSLGWIYGGKPGTPSKYIELLATDWPGHVPKDDDIVLLAQGGPTSYGKGVGVPTAKAGAAGETNYVDNPYAWLNPQLLRHILSGVKDNYLQNRLSIAEDVMNDYSEVIEGYRTHDAWTDNNKTTQTTRFELGQMYDEMQILLQQIANGLDYFGNPNGWVPMLSFEVALKAFNQEIDRSLDMVYLAKWITKKQNDATITLNALATARAGLRAEIETAQSAYPIAQQKLSGLTAKASAIATQVQNIQSKLQAEDNVLSAQARKNTKPSHWEGAGVLILQKVGAMAEMTPAKQPALGKAGAALGALADSAVDPSWDTITSVSDLSQSFNDSQLKAASASQSEKVADVKISALEGATARATYLSALSVNSKTLSAGIRSLNGSLEGTKAPQSDMDEELGKLRAQSAKYAVLADETSELLKEKAQFAADMAAATLKVARLSDTVTRNILAIDALDVEVGGFDNVIDSRVNAYLKDMERQAFDRLLKYHYYMAKAYEYRQVKAYTGTLDLEGMFERILSVVAGGEGETVGGALTSGQRELIKSAYLLPITELTESILTGLNETSQVVGTSRTFSLSPNQLTTLNSGKTLNLNLYEEGMFLTDEENVRIVNLEVLNEPNRLDGIGMTTEPSEGEMYGDFAFVELTMEHSGISNLKKDGKVFQFRHYNNQTRNPITWKSQYEPVQKTISPTPPIAGTDSLIMSLVNGLDASQQLLYSRPSAWADISIRREGKNGEVEFGLGDDNPPILITGITLRVTFDRETQGSNPNVKQAGIFARSDTGKNLSPRFEISEKDRNDRQNGAGKILRIFDTSTDMVDITTESVYGPYTFAKWMNNGNEYSTSNTISIPKNENFRLVAIYESLLPEFVSALEVTADDEIELEYQVVQQTKSDVTYSASGLPEGLTITSLTGLIRGTTDAIGNYDVELTMTNGDKSNIANITMLANLDLIDENDIDGDGIANEDDAFPSVAIGAYVDTDNDGAPDECDDACQAQGMTADADDDNDGIGDSDDAFSLIPIGDLLDNDSDGAPDECDTVCLSLGMIADTDDDNDGYDDLLELQSGTDPFDAIDIPSISTPRSRLLNIILIKSALDAKAK
jgi:hypothetical protein